MALLRRRRLPPELERAFDCFREVVRSVERAKQALTEAVPSTRFAGRPLPDVLVEFEASLQEASAGMPAWHCPELEEEWALCSAAIARALGLAERLRLEAPDLAGFEGLVGVLGDLLTTLEPFEAAAAAFRSAKVPSD